MSAGAKAGVGVGVALGVLLIMAIVGFALWRRRRVKRMQDGPHENLQQRPEMDGTGQVYETSAEEKKPKVLAEVEGDTRKVSELDAQAAKHNPSGISRGHTAELEGDGPMQRRF
ncbi:hypothetical protein CERZMDRAFT_89983 [Cercospora zeae-maydis SCOH1-5]|uniref:Uncharacterized protein n=1 Tax=Cercospora zeae-maydis SCOH1-5 TaxID=717836 RepID=A0A6A6FQN7_9PEZI|nr:hypothetical protein CERZMDRAFT_89983 [Cercospora zeae-maydis SCOH1-5]